MQTFFAILHLRLPCQLQNTSSFDIPVKSSDKPQYLPLKTSTSLEHTPYHIQQNKIQPGQKKHQENYFSCNFFFFCRISDTTSMGLTHQKDKNRQVHVHRDYLKDVLTRDHLKDVLTKCENNWAFRASFKRVLHSRKERAPRHLRNTPCLWASLSWKGKWDEIPTAALPIPIRNDSE